MQDFVHQQYHQNWEVPWPAGVSATLRACAAWYCLATASRKPVLSALKFNPDPPYDAVSIGAWVAGRELGLGSLLEESFAESNHSGLYSRLGGVRETRTQNPETPKPLNN